MAQPVPEGRGRGLSVVMNRQSMQVWLDWHVAAASMRAPMTYEEAVCAYMIEEVAECRVHAALIEAARVADVGDGWMPGDDVASVASAHDWATGRDEAEQGEGEEQASNCHMSPEEQGSGSHASDKNGDESGGDNKSSDGQGGSGECGTSQGEHADDKDDYESDPEYMEMLRNRGRPDPEESFFLDVEAMGNISVVRVTPGEMNCLIAEPVLTAIPGSREAVEAAEVAVASSTT